MNNIYNRRVIQAEKWKRPLDIKFKNNDIGRWLKYVVHHSGVVVTIDDGSRWLVHKGKNYFLVSFKKWSFLTNYDFNNIQKIMTTEDNGIKVIYSSSTYDKRQNHMKITKPLFRL